MARSPVPPRLPHFATPRSVHHLAAVAAGAYPPRRPPDAWSPGAPAPPGPCYWLDASETPVGWRGGCLALRLVRGAVRHYCLGGCSALVVCAPRSRPVRGAWAGARCRVFPVSPSRPAFPALCVAGRPVRVSLILACWYAIQSGLCVPRARSSCPSGFPRVSFVCVCVRSCSRAPPPPLVGVARAPRAVLLPGTGRAVPRGPCPSACPASVPCSVWFAWGGGGAAWSLSPPTWLGAVCSPWGGSARLGLSSAGGRVGCGGGLCAVLTNGGAAGASGAAGCLGSVRPSAFPGQATKWVSLTSLWQ